jgi:hypothetical protein
MHRARASPVVVSRQSRLHEKVHRVPSDFQNSTASRPFGSSNGEKLGAGDGALVCPIAIVGERVLAAAPRTQMGVESASAAPFGSTL